jgi:hypothetical protein
VLEAKWRKSTLQTGRAKNSARLSLSMFYNLPAPVLSRRAWQGFDEPF